MYFHNLSNISMYFPIFSFIFSYIFAYVSIFLCIFTYFHIFSYISYVGMAQGSVILYCSTWPLAVFPPNWQLFAGSWIKKTQRPSELVCLICLNTWRGQIVEECQCSQPFRVGLLDFDHPTHPTHPTHLHHPTHPPPRVFFMFFFFEIS